MEKVIYLGPFFESDQEEQILEKASSGINNAVNVFQWALLDGFLKNNYTNMTIINCLPVGTWPRLYKQLILKDRSWNYYGIEAYEIGCINLPFLKQYYRYRKTKLLLREITNSGDVIILYSAYLPFLKAIANLPIDISKVLIVTDLPEYYDLAKVSIIRKVLRKCQNLIIYNTFTRFNKFILLTEQMAKALKIGTKPYLIVEGICQCLEASERKQNNHNNADAKKVIFYSGTLNNKYGIDTLLDAFQLMQINNIELWICGSGEAEKKILAQSKIDSRIRFFGFCSRERVAELRDQATILINPRTNDGEYTKYSFPSKTMEYMASGKPVVMYKLDGIPEEYGKYLNFVNDSTTESLSTTIEFVLEHLDAANKKAGSARTFIMENKNSKKQVENIFAFLGIRNE